VRDEAKYYRLVEFGRVLPAIRTAIAKDLNGEGLTRRKVLAAIVKLRFRGKTGREHAIALDDRRLARILKRCRDLPGEELFTYIDENAAVSAVSSDDVNEYIREVAGSDFSAKDFRTWIGTVTDRTYATCGASGSA